MLDMGLDARRRFQNVLGFSDVDLGVEVHLNKVHAMEIWEETIGRTCTAIGRVTWQAGMGSRFQYEITSSYNVHVQAIFVYDKRVGKFLGGGFKVFFLLIFSIFHS